MSQSKLEWSVEDVFKVIHLYRQFPCLWDIRSSMYKRNDLKRNAWKEICKNMDKDEEEVRKKIKNLRSVYVAEKKKVENSQKSGSSAGDIYHSHLFYYHELNFLNSAVMFRKTASNLEKTQTPTLSDGQTPTFSYGQEDFKKPSKKYKVQREEKFNSAIDAFVRQADMSCSMASSKNEDESMHTAFGKSVASQLTTLIN